MKTWKSFQLIMAFLLAILLAVPPVVLAQDSKAAAAKRFSQEELDQILAPVALYPDSLLAQALMASTYPLEVVMADRWVKQNKNLTGDKLIEAADKQPWDPSVKALVPFPDLLSTMAEKLEWTEKLGDAFLAQQTDVMETVQSLRKKAYEAGNLKSTNEQHVIVEKETILVEPADPRVVYVPVYDPWRVYGPWWWPYYPPYVFYPYPYSAAVYYPGYIGFSAGFVVGAYWGNWGYCNWPYRTVYVNHHYSRHGLLDDLVPIAIVSLLMSLDTSRGVMALPGGGIALGGGPRPRLRRAPRTLAPAGDLLVAPLRIQPARHGDRRAARPVGAGDRALPGPPPGHRLAPAGTGARAGGRGRGSGDHPGALPGRRPDGPGHRPGPLDRGRGPAGPAGDGDARGGGGRGGGSR